MSVRKETAHPAQSAPSTRRLDEVLAAGMRQMEIGVRPEGNAKDARQKRIEKERALGADKRKARITEQRKMDGLLSPVKPLDAVGMATLDEEIASLFEAMEFAERYVLPSTGSPEEMLLGVMIGVNRMMEHLGVADGYEMELFYESAQTFLAFAASEDYKQLVDAFDKSTTSSYEQTPQSGPDDVGASADIGGFFNEKNRGQAVREAFKNKGNWEVFTGYFEGVRDWENLVREGKMLEAYQFLKSVGKDGLRELLLYLTRTYVPAGSWLGSLFRDEGEIGMRDDLDWYYGFSKAAWRLRHFGARPDQMARGEIANAAIAKFESWQSGVQGDGFVDNVKEYGKDLLDALSFGVYDSGESREKKFVPPRDGVDAVKEGWWLEKVKGRLELVPSPQRLAYYAVSSMARIWTKCLLFRIDTIESWAALNSCTVMKPKPDGVLSDDCAQWYQEIDAHLQARILNLDRRNARMALYAAEFKKWKKTSTLLNKEVKKKPKAKATGWAGGSITMFSTLLNVAGQVSSFAVATEFLPAALFTIHFFAWRHKTMKLVNKMSGVIAGIKNMEQADGGGGGDGGGGDDDLGLPPLAPMLPMPNDNAEAEGEEQEEEEEEEEEADDL